MTDGELTGAEPGSAATRKIFRGGVLLALAKGWFLIASYGLLATLPWAAGGGVDGNRLVASYKLVNGWLSLVGTVLVTGTIQAVSRFTAMRSEGRSVLFSRALRLEGVVGVVAGSALFLSAPWVARRSPELIPALRIGAAVPVAYAVHAVVVGFLNGCRAFGGQAGLDVVMTTLKVIGILGGAWLFGGAAPGAFLGFGVAAFAVAALGVTCVMHRLDLGDRSRAPRLRDLLAFQMRTVLFMFLVQWVVQMDQWYVVWFGTMSDAPFPVPGRPGITVSASELAQQTFAVSQTFASVSYAAVTVVALLLFPLVARTASTGDRTETGRLLGRASRFALIAAGGVFVVFATDPAKSLGLLLDLRPHATLVAGSPHGPLLELALATVRPLGLGHVALAWAFLIGSALSAAGRPLVSVALMACTGVIQVGLGRWWVPTHGPFGQGLASALAHGIAALAFFVVGRRLLGLEFPFATLVRVGLAGGFTFLVVAVCDPSSSFITFALAGGSFVGALLLSGEVRRAEWAALRRRFRGVAA